MKQDGTSRNEILRPTKSQVNETRVHRLIARMFGQVSGQPPGI